MSFYPEASMKIGFDWEIRTSYLYDFYGLTYINHNPTNYQEWKRKMKDHEHDKMVYVKSTGLWLSVDDKFLNVCIRPSWYNRGWHRHADIYVTNDKNLVHPKIRNQLALYGHKLFNPYELIKFCLGINDSNIDDTNTSLGVVFVASGLLVNDSVTFNETCTIASNYDYG